jgi:hypothetical protein
VNFVFGQVQKKKEDNLALFSISDFDKSRNLFATLKSQIQADKRRLYCFGCNQDTPISSHVNA